MKRREVVFVENLKYLRSIHDYRMREVSKHLGIPLKRYQSYEEGRAFPKVDLLYNIASFYGETMESLCFDNSIQKNRVWLKEL